MSQTICKCGSFGINPNLHGREKDVDLDLCDVCYWRRRAETAQATILEMRKGTRINAVDHAVAQLSKPIS